MRTRELNHTDGLTSVYSGSIDVATGSPFCFIAGFTVLKGRHDLGIDLFLFYLFIF